MAFDLGEDDDDGGDDGCPICTGWGHIFESVPLLNSGPIQGEIILRRNCIACFPGLSSCQRCAGIGFFTAAGALLCELVPARALRLTYECKACRDD